MSADFQLWPLNPWWKAKEKIDDDESIKEWVESAINYQPNLRYRIKYDYEPDNTVVYTLRGLRQVGKTTLIKLQIRDFLTEQGRCPWNIFYYFFDQEDSRDDLISVIRAYLKLSRNYREESRIYLFLDEITVIEEWQRGIKFLHDTGELKNCTVLAAGSQAPKILEGGEHLSGRRGRTADPYDWLLPPMKFAEFIKIRNREITQFMREHRLFERGDRKKMLQRLFSKEAPEEIKLLYNNFIDDLNHYLDEYMLTGGTPKIVSEKVKRNFLSPELYGWYLEGIKSDLKPRSGARLKRLVGAIADNLSSKTSWNKLREKAGIGSTETVQDYADVLGKLSVTSTIYRYGEKKKAPRIKKEKKIYFSDPFYLHMFNAWHGSGDPFEASEEFLNDTNREKVVEGIVANHLIRLAFALSENRHMFDYNDNVFFWSEKKGRKEHEVDFVLYVDGTAEVPIEVKYRHNIDYRELGGIVSFQKKTGIKDGLVLSKDELDARRDYLVIPASVFLMLV